MIRASADPGRAGRTVSRLGPSPLARLDEDPALAEAVVAVAAASGWVGRLLASDPTSIDVLADLDRRRTLVAGDAAALTRWRRLEVLRIAARDLTGIDPLEATMAALSAMAASVLDAALGLVGSTGLAVVAMGKAGANELNYSSDVDVVVVGRDGAEAEEEAARRCLGVARSALRIDAALRPGGRDGRLVRTVDGYRSHWERWAEPWERQALLKARFLAGDDELGRAFEEAAAEHLWGRPFDAEAIHQVRTMKARTEERARLARGGADEVKRTPGGIRDVEFSAQLLQLVHGPLDSSLRVRGTLPALTLLADGGYIDPVDAGWLRASYRFLRRVEHAVQLDEDRQTHVVPAGRGERDRLARVLGLRDTPKSSAVEELDRELAACRTTVRRIHERVYFRPLLDAFGQHDAPLDEHAAALRLAAFGFTDAERTRQAVSELTRGLTRTSRLMVQTLPLLLDWLSRSPDPDGGLLALRRLVDADARAVAAACRDSPETARRLCLLAGTSPQVAHVMGREPDLLGRLGPTRHRGDQGHPRVPLLASARGDRDDRRLSLRRAARREVAQVAAADVLDDLPLQEVGAALAAIAEAAVVEAVAIAGPQVPFAVLALGRAAGGELSYASDLDLLLVHDAADDKGREEALRIGEVVRRVLQGTGPADRIYDVDLDLRPGGRSAPPVRSRASVVAHVERWAEPWERLALTRLRPVAGDVALGRAVVDALDPLVWQPLDDGARRAIRRIKARREAERLPAGDDVDFHLKLGRGALSDVELTVALLLLEHGLRHPRTGEGIAALRRAGHLSVEEEAALSDAHDSCERIRNRQTLMAGRPRQALPSGGELVALARSLGTTGSGLRDVYQRTTRRARRVVERRFYGRSP